MASPRASHLRPLLVLGVFLAAWWLTPAAARVFAKKTFARFEAPAWHAYAGAKDLQDYWALRLGGEDALLTAGRDLARENAALQLQLQESARWQQEAAQLAELLQLPRATEFRYEVARVLRRDQNAWWNRLIIGKGSADGLTAGQGVVFAGGVVGRVKEAGADSAVIELASSPSFRIAAMLGADPRPVIFQGGETPAFGAPRGEVRDVAADVRVPATGPLRLMSSGLGGDFPPGLSLGWVEGLALSSNGLFQSGPVRLDPALSGLREVAVLVPVKAAAPLPAAAPARGAARANSPAARAP